MDYGKLAYLKAEDLSRRLSLNETSSGLGNDSVVFSLAKRTSYSNGTKQTFNFFLSGAATVEICVEGFFSSENTEEAEIVVMINGMVLTTQKVSAVSYTPAAFKIVKQLKKYNVVNNKLSVYYACSSYVTQQLCCVTVRGKGVSASKLPYDIGVASIGSSNRYFRNSGTDVELYTGVPGVPTVYMLPFSADAVVPLYPYRYFSAGAANNSQLCFVTLCNRKMNFINAESGVVSPLNGTASKVSAASLSQNNESVFLAYAELGKVYTATLKILNEEVSASGFKLTELSGVNRVTEVKVCSYQTTLFLALETKDGIILASSPVNTINFTVENTLNVKNLLSVDFSSAGARVFYTDNGCVKVMTASNLKGQFTSKAVRYCDKIVCQNNKYLILDSGEMQLTNA